MRRPSVSRMREIRTYGLKGDLRKRSRCATAPEVYQWIAHFYFPTIRNLWTWFARVRSAVNATQTSCSG